MTLWENPIFRREGWPGRLARSRGRRFLVLGLALLSVALGGSVALMLGSVNWSDPQGAADVLFGLLLIKWLFIRVLAVILPAMAIAVERQRQSWDTLILTGLTPRDLLLGKLASRLVPGAMWAAFFLPMELVLLVGANVGTQQEPVTSEMLSPSLAAVWYVLFNLTQIVIVITYGTMGIWCSVRSRSALNAVISALVFVAAFGILSSIPWAVLSGLVGQPWATLSMGMPSAVIAIPFVWILWGVMLRRFSAWDEEVRNGVAPVRKTQTAHAV